MNRAAEVGADPRSVMAPVLRPGRLALSLAAVEVGDSHTVGSSLDRRWLGCR